MAARLTHLTDQGAAHMVDVAAKAVTTRTARASGAVVMSAKTLDLILAGSMVKGDVIAVARVAGIMAAKKTHDLIPLCHPLALTDLLVTVTPDRVASGLRIRAEAATVGPTGVEMEALTAASVAALTAYDMVKGVERAVEIRFVRLVSKSGGQSGEWHRPADAAAGAPGAGPGLGYVAPRKPRPGERTAGRIRKK